MWRMRLKRFSIFRPIEPKVSGLPSTVNEVRGVLETKPNSKKVFAGRVRKRVAPREKWDSIQAAHNVRESEVADEPICDAISNGCSKRSFKIQFEAVSVFKPAYS